MTDWTQHQDDISDAISDSMDMDWSANDGARAVVRWLNENKPLIADTPRVTVPVEVVAACKGEQEHFEAWAKLYRYDLSQHPLHYIFTDPKTDAARMGWKAALAYVRDAAEPLSAAPAPEGWAVNHEALAKVGYEASCNKKWEWASRGCKIGWIDAVKAILAALATREEAPAEAGVQETLRVLLDNLVIAQSLSKELRQRATDEARSYLSALRAQPPAREDAQPVGWKHTDKCWGKTSCSDEMAHCYCQKEQEKEASLQPVGWLRPDTLKGLMDADESVVDIQSLVAAHETKHNTVAVYTHPAPDALRVAVEDAIKQARWIENFSATTSGEREAIKIVTEPLRQALAALQAEQGAK